MKERLIYISPDETSFTRKDIDFLSKRYLVETIQQPWSDNSKIFLNFWWQFVFLLKMMPKSDAVFVMFGGYWSFLPALLGRMLKKPVFIILGGADCVSFPEYNYGSLRKPLLRRIIKWSYMLADRLLPVDESLVVSEYQYDMKVREKNQGFKSHFPGLKTPYTVINNGFDAAYWNADNTRKDPLVFTTIAKVTDHSRYVTKGIDLVIRIAGHFPDHRFNIIGMDLAFAKSLGSLPSNIILHDFLSPGKIKEILNESRFYLQLSISEGFPNALCEAMLCECIPICSKVGGMPFIVQDSGVLIEYRDIDLILKKVMKIIHSHEVELKSLGEKARKNVSERFPINLRENAFFKVLDKIRNNSD